MGFQNLMNSLRKYTERYEANMAAEEFNKFMRNYFGATEGAFSIVTSDERSKSQVTFVGPERAIADKIFGEKLYGRHGNKDILIAQGIDPALDYRLFPTGKVVSLTTSFKTNRPNELRYYMSADAFKPEAGEYWGIFERDGEPWLCSFSEKLLSAIQNGDFQKPDGIPYVEPEVDEFQDVVNGVIQKSEKFVDTWQRSAAVSKKALEYAGYNCELFPKWRVFESKATGKPYMEAHHIVPMKLQGHFGEPLDATDNICCLNPLAHRLIHHGHFGQYEKELVGLLDKRKELLVRLQIIKDDVLSMYYNA